MPAKRAAKTFDYPDFAEYDLRHNPGYDFLRMLGQCAEADETAFRAVFAPYSRHPIAILLGGAAMEGYVSYVGHAVVPDWASFVTPRMTFSEKLKGIFKVRGKNVSLGSGIYQQAIALAKFRGSLAHPRFTHHIEQRDSPPPNLFDHIEADYPAARVFDIVTRFRETFLGDVGLDDLWWIQKYDEVILPNRNPRVHSQRSAKSQC